MEETRKERKMQYVITGITHEAGYRIFSFEGVVGDRVRPEFKVRADLALTRSFGIRVQELPLLCRALLEGRDESVPARLLTFTEGDMRRNAELGAALAAQVQKKRAPRRVASENLGAAWRASQA